MVEGRVHTHGTLSAVRRRSERSARSQSSFQVRQPATLSRLGVDRWTLSCLGVDQPPYCPPRAPTLAPHGENVRCKKTYRATQRTHLLASVTL